MAERHAADAQRVEPRVEQGALRDAHLLHALERRRVVAPAHRLGVVRARRRARDGALEFDAQPRVEALVRAQRSLDVHLEVGQLGLLLHLARLLRADPLREPARCDSYMRACKVPNSQVSRFGRVRLKTTRLVGTFQAHIYIYPN